MKIGVWAGAALAALALGSVVCPAEAADLELRRVLLSSGGVGYFEYEAEVQGSEELPLEVRIDQIDDVLKSIVVFDDQGRLGEVVLPGREGLREVFRDLPFDESALDSAAAMVGAMRGAEVRVVAPEGTFEGRIMSVTPEQVALPGGGTITRHRLTVESNGSLRQVILEDVLSLTFLDPALQQQIDAALQALLGQQERGHRELLIRLDGAGTRRVRVGYVVEVPLWKATYRLTLSGDAGADTSDLQGFAVVENRSGQDWVDVDLTLTSGSPVTFRQALYDTYYVERPEVPVDLVNRVLPRLDEGVTAIVDRGGVSFAAPSSALDEGADDAPAREAEIAAAEAVQSISQVAYHLPLPVTLATGQTAILPVISATLPTERLSIYQPEIEARHPLASARLTNTTGGDLPPGAMTVYERTGPEGQVTYAGDARLAPVPMGQDRLVTFAIDQAVTIDEEEQSDQVLTTATIVDGVLQLTQTDRRTTVYTIEGAADGPRTVILEHPRVAGFTLVRPEGATAIEETETHYRIRVEVPAGETVTLDVVLERPRLQTVRILDTSREQILAYASSTTLPEPIRAALTRVAELQAVVADRQSALAALESEVARITSEQARIRENLRVVPAGSDLAARYLMTLGEQESRLAVLRGEIDQAARALANARRALADYVRGLGG